MGRGGEGWMKTLRRKKKKKSGMEGCGPRGLVGMLLRMFCCLEFGVWSLLLVGALGSWVLVYMNLGRVLLGLAMLHVVGGVEEEDRAW